MRDSNGSKFAHSRLNVDRSTRQKGKSRDWIRCWHFIGLFRWENKWPLGGHSPSVCQIPNTTIWNRILGLILPKWLFHGFHVQINKQERYRSYPSSSLYLTTQTIWVSDIKVLGNWLESKIYLLFSSSRNIVKTQPKEKHSQLTVTNRKIWGKFPSGRSHLGILSLFYHFYHWDIQRKDWGDPPPPHPLWRFETGKCVNTFSRFFFEHPFIIVKFFLRNNKNGFFSKGWTGRMNQDSRINLFSLFIFGGNTFPEQTTLFPAYIDSGLSDSNKLSKNVIRMQPLVSILITQQTT